MGRTTMEIDDELLAEAMELTGAKSKRDAVNSALREFIRRRTLDRFREELGTFDLDLDLEQLRRMREMD